MTQQKEYRIEVSTATLFFDVVAKDREEAMAKAQAWCHVVSDGLDLKMVDGSGVDNACLFVCPEDDMEIVDETDLPPKHTEPRKPIGGTPSVVHFTDGPHRLLCGATTGAITIWTHEVSCTKCRALMQPTGAPPGMYIHLSDADS